MQFSEKELDRWLLSFGEKLDAQIHHRRASRLECLRTGFGAGQNKCVETLMSAVRQARPDANFRNLIRKSGDLKGDLHKICELIVNSARYDPSRSRRRVRERVFKKKIIELGNAINVQFNVNNVRVAATQLKFHVNDAVRTFRASPEDFPQKLHDVCRILNVPFYIKTETLLIRIAGVAFN